MVAQTVTIDRIPRSTTVSDVIRNAMGSDVPNLDQHVLFYVYGKGEKRVKSTTHLHRLLARSKHRVHFVVKKRVNPRCQSGFGTKAKLLLQNMKFMFNEDRRNQATKSNDHFPTFEALSTECKRRRLTGDAFNVYESDIFNKFVEKDKCDIRRHHALSPLQHEFELRYADNEIYYNGLHKDKVTEDQTLRERPSTRSPSERVCADGSPFVVEKDYSMPNDIVSKRTMLKTIHPLKLFGVVTPRSDKVPRKHKRQISTNTMHYIKFTDKQTSMKKRKLNTNIQHAGAEEVNCGRTITTSDQAGDYVLLRGHDGALTKNSDSIIEEWDSAFEDDNDISI